MKTRHGCGTHPAEGITRERERKRGIRRSLYFPTRIKRVLRTSIPLFRRVTLPLFSSLLSGIETGAIPTSLIFRVTFLFVSNKHRDRFRGSLTSRSEPLTKFRSGLNRRIRLQSVIFSLLFSCKKKGGRTKESVSCVYVCTCMCVSLRIKDGARVFYVFFIQTWQRLIRDLRLPAFRVCFSGLLNCWPSSIVTIQKLY